MVVRGSASKPKEWNWKRNHQNNTPKQAIGNDTNESKLRTIHR
jgi:hypothetical protein